MAAGRKKVRQLDLKKKLFSKTEQLRRAK